MSVCAIYHVCLINKTLCFLFLATSCLLRSTDILFLCFPQCLKPSHRHLQDKCWTKWRDWSFLTSVYIIHAEYLENSFQPFLWNILLMDWVFLLFVSLLIKKNVFGSSSSVIDLASGSKILIVYPNFYFAAKTVITRDISFLGRA